MNMRNATCVGTKTSKIPTRVTLLLIFYSVLVLTVFPFAGLQDVHLHEYMWTAGSYAFFTCFLRYQLKVMKDKYESVRTSLALQTYKNIHNNTGQHLTSSPNTLILQPAWTLDNALLSQASSPDVFVSMHPANRHVLTESTTTEHTSKVPFDPSCITTQR